MIPRPRFIARVSSLVVMFCVACVFGSAPATAIQLRWSTGTTDLTVNQNTQAVLVVQADSAEVTLPDSWRLLWTADSLGIQLLSFDQACLVDTAKVDWIAPPTTPADSAANQVTAYFCSSGSSNATTATWLIDLPAGGRGKLKVTALSPVDTALVIESNEVTFNGGVDGGYSPTILAASYTHSGSTLTVTAVGSGFSLLSSAELTAKDGSWSFPLTIVSQSDGGLTATGSSVAAVPACLLEAETGSGGALQAPLEAESINLPETPLFAPATMYDPDSNYYPRDFAMIYTPGKVHLIYIRHNRLGEPSQPVPDNVNEMEFGHQWTSDWSSWNFNSLPLDTTILKTSGAIGTWDNRHVWAPHIVQQGLTFYMYYTGVYFDPNTGRQHQSIGLARSTDLDNWTRSSLASWGVDSVTASWIHRPVAGDPYSGNKQCRDPFVMPDPEHPGKWLLYYTTLLNGALPNQVVGVARTRDSLGGRWTDVGPIVKTTSPNTFSPVAESPHLMFTHGKWYLFYTTNAGHQVNWLTVNGAPVDTIASDSTRWSFQTRLYNYLLGHSSAAASTVQYWAASEYMSVEGQEFIGAYDGSGIRVGKLEWWSASPDSFTLITPSFAAVDDSAHQPKGTRLFLAGLRPGVSRIELGFELPSAGAARVVVYDVLGRMVRTLLDGPAAPGRTMLTWDGRSASGERVGSGIYFARLVTSQGDRTTRVPLIR